MKVFIKIVRAHAWLESIQSYSGSVFKGSSTNNFYVTVNRFCLLGIPPLLPPPTPPPPHTHTHTPSLFLTYNIKLDGIPSKIKWKIQACFIMHSSFEGTFKKNLQNIAATSSSYYISFYISRYHFLQLFRTWFKIIYKKILSQISLF